MRVFRKRYRLRYPLWFALTSRTLTKLAPSTKSVCRTTNRRDRLVKMLAGTQPSVSAMIINGADGFAEMTGGRYTIDGPVIFEAEGGLIYQGVTILNPPAVHDLRLGEGIVRRSICSLIRHPPAGRGCELKRVLIIRHAWEQNYFHLINDTIAQFRLLAEEHDLSRSEVWVSPAVWTNPLFSLFRTTSPFLRGICVRPQPHNVKTAGLTFAKVPHADVANFDFLLNQMGIGSNERSAVCRLFVNRRPEMGRCIANVEELETALRARGFRTIYPGEMSVAEQINAFVAAEVVVGIHGAGLTNIIFRRSGKMSLIEIFTPNMIAPHYASICAEYGFEYRAVVGLAHSPSARDGLNRYDPTYTNFTVDISDVIDAVDTINNWS